MIDLGPEPADLFRLGRDLINQGPHELVPNRRQLSPRRRRHGRQTGRLIAAGRDSYGAGQDWREGNNDDLALSVGIAVWYGETALAGVPAAFEAALEDALSWQAGGSWRR